MGRNSPTSTIDGVALAENVNIGGNGGTGYQDPKIALTKNHNLAYISFRTAAATFGNNVQGSVGGVCLSDEAFHPVYLSSSSSHRAMEDKEPLLSIKSAVAAIEAELVAQGKADLCSVMRHSN